ncbi:uncharacterized protein LOC144663188 [Oculina patagonica]
MDEAAAAEARAAIQRLKDDLPEEEKKGNVGKIITYILNLVQGGWSFRQAQQNVGELQKLGQHMTTIESKLEELAEGGKEAILQALDYQKRNSTQSMKDYYCDNLSVSLHELYDHVAGDKITEHEKTKQLILDSLKSYQQDRSNELVTNMVKGSAFVAAFQAVKIYMAWKTISNASNVIKENPIELTTINRNLERMERMVIEFLELCERNPRDSRVNQKMMKINTLFTSTLGKISSKRVKIDGHIQRLDLIADYSAIDGMVNAATAVTHGLQLWQTWANLTSYTKFLGSAMAAVFAGFAVANFTECYLSRNTLEDLRRDLREVMRLQDMLQDLHDQAAEAFSTIPE